MIRLVILLLSASSALAQPASERWLISYDRKVAIRLNLHGPNESVVRPEKARLTLEPKGDSLRGQLVAVATDDAPERVIGDVRGVRTRNGLALSIYTPVKPMGFVATQWDALMIWLRETVHGVSPTHVEMHLTTSGGDIRGTRSVVTADGTIADAPRPVSGRRE